MNEVSKIHLGRQAFTISADAHKALRAYLDDIKKQVQDESVVDEVELRIAELLAEHGISGDKVVLPADITFIKEQLGEPKDFKEDGDEEQTTAQPSDTKRFFRDTENGMLAGVASGLAAYTGIDAWIIRVLFIIGVFTGGWGVVLYLLLWLVVPEAKTSSDRLQMAGKPITVSSLKEVVDRADVKGATTRAHNTLAGPINSFFSIVLKIIGIGFIVTGISTIFGLITAESFLVFHNGKITQDNIFPVGLKEHLLVDIVLCVATIIAVFIILAGMAMFRRKWPVRAWVSGLLVTVLLVGVAVSGALVADVGPTVRDRYNANFHYAVRVTPTFNTVDFAGDNINTDYQYANTYSVVIKYFGNQNVSAITTNVTNSTLLVDSTRFNQNISCNKLCIPLGDSVTVTVRSPSPPAFPDPDTAPDVPNVPAMPKQLMKP